MFLHCPGHDINKERSYEETDSRCGAFFLLTLLQELPENAVSMNEWDRPYYILLIVLLLHSISLSVIYKTLREL